MTVTDAMQLAKNIDSVATMIICTLTHTYMFSIVYVIYMIHCLLLVKIVNIFDFLSIRFVAAVILYDTIDIMIYKI